MNQEKKKELAPQIKEVLKKYGMKGSIGVHNYSSIVVNIKEGKLDLIGQANLEGREYAERTGQRYYEIEDYLQVNTYHADKSNNPVIAMFYKELISAMNGEGSAIANHDNSDLMTDYFDVGWYLEINVGKWNKPYILTGVPVEGMLNDNVEIA